MLISVLFFFTRNFRFKSIDIVIICIVIILIGKI